MEGDPPPPSLPWRFGSATVMGFIGILTRTFMYGANSMETHGLDGFLNLVDERRDIDQRRRGLITGECSLLLAQVSQDLTLAFPSIKSHFHVRTCHSLHRRSHISKGVLIYFHSLDDPMMWGILPYRYHFNPSNHRWSLGSSDIVFKNKLVMPQSFRL